MSPVQRRDALNREIEDVVNECREDIHEAVRDYAEEVRTALEDLECNLSESGAAIH
ncbi:MAG: hypothetical protein V1798_11450 [Pseudomonadota bacterium]